MIQQDEVKNFKKIKNSLNKMQEPKGRLIRLPIDVCSKVLNWKAQTEIVDAAEDY